jgi:DNA-binding NtrC family response regulator
VERAVSLIVALTQDLMFASNIEATMRRAGYEVATVETFEELREAVKDAAALVILDLHAGSAVADVVAVADQAPVLAFGRHTEPATLREARQAGCAEVVPRSTFVAEMTALVMRLALDQRVER